ncbi:MAG: CBS domain-containing protein [Sedimentisphaerales bacterium]|nr:CBS domain-containing protein [Sedimentisphaerales bacterium]
MTGSQIQSGCCISSEERQPRDGEAAGPAQAQLTLGDIMSEPAVTASPTESASTAASRMCNHGVSCLVVMDDGVVGVLTQKDLLLGISVEPDAQRHITVADHMSSATVVAPPDLPVLEASRLLKSKHVKHLPVVVDGQLVGIVTQTDITRSLIHLAPLQCVSDVMSPRVITVSTEATVADTARLMWSRNISCVVVMHAHEPVGLVSQRDVLVRVVSQGKDFSTQCVTDIMSTPILFIPSHYSVFTASRLMDKMKIHRLVVQDAKRVCGIVSQTDILKAVEKNLAEEEKYQLLLVRSDLPIFLLDQEGLITYVNPAFVRLFDKNRSEEVVGTPFAHECLWDRPVDRERLSRVLESSRSGLVRAVVHDGADECRRVLVLLTASHGVDGEISGWQGVAWPVPRRNPA